MELPEITLGDVFVSGRHSSVDDDTGEVIGNSWTITRPVYVNDEFLCSIKLYFRSFHISPALCSKERGNQAGKRHVFELNADYSYGGIRYIKHWLAYNREYLPDIPDINDSNNGAGRRYKMYKARLNEENLIKWIDKYCEDEMESIRLCCLWQHDKSLRSKLRKKLKRWNKDSRKKMQEYMEHMTMLKQGFECYTPGCDISLLDCESKMMKIVTSIKTSLRSAYGNHTHNEMRNLKLICWNCYKIERNSTITKWGAIAAIVALFVGLIAVI